MKKTVVLLSLAALLAAALATTPAFAAPHLVREGAAVSAAADTLPGPGWMRYLPAWLLELLDLLDLSAAGDGPERSLAAASTEGEPDPDPCAGGCTDGGVIGDPNG